MNIWRDFHGPNAAYVSELYERFKQDPNSVDQTTRTTFEALIKAEGVAGVAMEVDIDKVVGVANLAQSIREFGHLSAKLDPLGSDPPGDPLLKLETHNLTEDDLLRLPAHLVGGPLSKRAANALEAIEALRRAYSSTSGYEDDHIQIHEERAWLREAVESGRYRDIPEAVDLRNVLVRLTEVEIFEHFLHRIFPGKTRFSIEGLDVMIPLLDEVVHGAAESGIRNILIGMAHRGRLNVLAHILKKPYSQILAEFKDPVKARKFTDDLGWTGDVKYHAGAQRTVQEEVPIDLFISMAPNPSHLEAVNPVVLGMARAAGTRVDQKGEPRFDSTVTLPILIHGDAAFPAQGIVAETLNLSRVSGYSAGGTIHIIANNQLGFTTSPNEGRSTLYASDIAKGFEIPIVHVNADDPEACIAAARLGFAYRSKFKKDFLIDLVGYRRYGHNEGDEPSFTQPVMYEKIRNHPSVREKLSRRLMEEGVIEQAESDDMVRRRMELLQRELDSLKAEEALLEPLSDPPPPGAARRVQTTVPADRLQKLNERLLNLPDDFHVHRKLEKAIQRRRELLKNIDDRTIDWAAAEELAFATILEDGIAIRLSGQDVERGTFSHRHSVFHDAKTGAQFVPLQALETARVAFEVLNSPLSEAAAIGFEYGYNVQEPGRLVVWEAQYGDFINGAQVHIDEFVASARAKWGQTPSLVLLLPHAYEGQGPDHSSGRLERFLSLSAEINLRIANCTTAAQYFHLLRRQAALLKVDPLPLVVMTPKSLLRNPHTFSSLRDLSEGSWQPVIDDPIARKHPGHVRRLIFCSGKIFVDLISSDERKENDGIAIVRLEQIYPFRPEFLEAVIESYPKLEEIVWVQEEPENMGAWPFYRIALEKLLQGRWPLYYIGRRSNSSPAEGSSAWHSIRQKRILEQALRLPSLAAEEMMKVRS